MSDASSMATATMAGQSAGLAMQTVGSFYAAKGQKMQLELQAKLAEINAQITEGQARDILQQGNEAQAAVKMKGAQIKSGQRVAMGASGVDLASETAVALQTSTDYLAELDAKTVKLNALRSAWGQRMQAVNLRSQAGMARASASAINPIMAATGTLLGSGGNLMATATKYKSAGLI